MFSYSIPAIPWDNWVKRVIIHVPQYLSPYGGQTSGGRQRNVRDITELIRHKWGRDCIIIQKAFSNWESEDLQGTEVIGLKSKLNYLGDPGFGRATAKFIQKGDAIIYMGGEDAYPYFVKEAKGFHVGIWWDGPFPSYKKWLTGIRTEALFESCRSVLCVDTNIINWLRARSARNQKNANRAVYIPNCVDIDKIPRVIRDAPNKPLRLLFARRYEPKRGADLALDACAILIKKGINVRLIMSTTQGQSGTVKIREGATARGIEANVETYENDLDSIYSLYNKADVAIVPTLWSEGTSFSCVEAIAAGLPVVTTTVGGLPNLIIPGFNGYVTPPEPESISKAIQALIDESHWKTMHENCLSMRYALSRQLWNRRVLDWLKA